MQVRPHTHRTARINHFFFFFFFAFSYFNSFIKRSLELGEKGERVSPSFRSIFFFFLSFFYTRHAGLDETERAKRFKHSSLTDYVLCLIVRSFIRSFIDSLVRSVVRSLALFIHSFIHSSFFWFLIFLFYSFQFHRQNCDYKLGFMSASTGQISFDECWCCCWWLWKGEGGAGQRKYNLQLNQIHTGCVFKVREVMTIDEEGHVHHLAETHVLMWTLPTTTGRVRACVCVCRLQAQSSRAFSIQKRGSNSLPWSFFNLFCGPGIFFSFLFCSVLFSLSLSLFYLVLFQLVTGGKPVLLLLLLLLLLAVVVLLLLSQSFLSIEVKKVTGLILDFTQAPPFPCLILCTNNLATFVHSTAQCYITQLN